MTLTLDDARNDALRRLADAASDRKSPMHTPVIATLDAELRVMVLRAFERDTWTMRFHTDARAPKVKTIGDRARVGVLFYDSEAGVQLRCRGMARIETESATVDAAWSSSDNYARRCYLGAPPGEVADGPTSGLPEWIEGEKPTDAQLDPARPHFAALLVELAEIDWYRLAHDGHRRALLTPSGGHWLTP